MTGTGVLLQYCEFAVSGSRQGVVPQLGVANEPSNKSTLDRPLKVLRRHKVINFSLTKDTF
jgi:hypothetical protein